MARGGFRVGSGSKPGEKRGKYKVKSTIRKEFEALDISHLGPKFLKVLENALDDADPRVQRWAFEQMRQYVFVPQTPNTGNTGAGLVLNLTMPVKEVIDGGKAVESMVISSQTPELLPEAPLPPPPSRPKEDDRPQFDDRATFAPNLGDQRPEELRKSPVEIAQMSDEEYREYLDALAIAKKPANVARL